MKISAVFPQLEIGNDPIIVRDFAQGVESLGYDWLQVPDMVIGAYADRPGGIKGFYNHQSAHHEVFVLLGYLAALTKSIQLATGVLILPQRPSVLVAKQAAEVDLLSGGRLVLGVGLGDMDLQMQALGYDFTNRGVRIEEQIEILRALWMNERVTFHGKFHTIDDMGILPRPCQQPIPIWFGGESDAALRRMARLGDGWMLSHASPSEARPSIEKLWAYLKAVGRSPREFGINARIDLTDQGRGTWASLVQDWETVGATMIRINSLDAGFENLDKRLEALRLFKKETLLYC
jgi:probable F420-dependent oxidoreductase